MKNQLPKLSKGATEKIIMAVIVIAALGYGSWTFVLAPLGEQKVAILAELETVNATLRGNKTLVGIQAKTKANYEAVQKELAEKMVKDMPPRVNELAWAGDFYRKVSMATGSGIRARSVSATGAMAMPAARPGQQSIFEEYGVRTDYQCDLNEFGRYLAALETEDSLMRVDGFEISSSFQGGEAEKLEQPGKLTVILRTSFLRFTATGFRPEERPDAPMPRVVPKEAAKKDGAAASGE